MVDLNELRKKMKKRKEIVSSFSSSKLHRDTLKDDDHRLKEAEYHYHLGKCYDHGLEGYSEDEEKEYQEYQIAAQLGHVGAMVELAADYADEDYSTLGYDLNKAEMWARRAIERGNPDGYKVLYDVNVAKKDYSLALNFLEIGVENGSLDAIEQRAWMLYWGENAQGEEIECSEEEAYKLIKDKVWTDEHTMALLLMGYLHKDNGNYKLAKEYFERLLRIDDEDYGAMVALGNLLRNEEEVRDYQQASKLLKIAAENGNFSAMNSYGVMLYTGDGIEQDEKAAISWFNKAAQNGFSAAMINLGDIFEGENNEEALKWYNEAMKAGAPEAEQRIHDLNQQKIDFTRSSQIIDDFMKDWDNISEMEPYASVSQSFPNRLKKIQDVIDREGLSVYEIDRLKAFQAAISLLYFDYHLNNERFTSLRTESYYTILDHIDDLVKSMETISNEAAFIYYLANMYSATRFQDASPASKLKEFWDNLREIELVEDETEWKVDFWEKKAEEIHNYMLSQIGSYSTTPSQNSTDGSNYSSTSSRQPIRRRRDQDYFITDRCISCGTCQPCCPVDAIHAGEPYWIDPDMCISCGCCSAVCPCDAINN